MNQHDSTMNNIHEALDMITRSAQSIQPGVPTSIKVSRDIQGNVRVSYTMVHYLNNRIGETAL